MTALRIFVAGAPGTGKSRLCADLNGGLNVSGVDAIVAVSHAAVLADPDFIFLMGLESISEPSVEADRAIRAALTQNGMPHDVLYGSPGERLSQALNIVMKRLANPASEYGPSDDNRGGAKRWKWECEKCSDPHCEHRLLSDLLKNRHLSQTTEP